MDGNIFMQIWQAIIQEIQSIPVSTRYMIIAIVVGFGSGNLAYLIADMLNYHVFKLTLLLQNRSRKKSRKNSRENMLVTHAGVIYHPAVFSTTITPNDIYGVSEYNWELIFATFVGLGTVIGISTDPDPFLGGLYGLTFSLSLIYGGYKFFIYLRKVKTRKDALDVLDLLQEYIAIERNSLNNAMNRIKEMYINHVVQYGKSSWMYKNYVLARLVFLISTQPGYIPQDILAQLGEELGEVDSIRRVMSNASSLIGQTGDAGSVIKEQIATYYESYVQELQEAIPQLSDKLFVPVMITHFLPFLIILLWPVIETIYIMMSGDIMSGDISNVPTYLIGK